MTHAEVREDGIAEAESLGHALDLLLAGAEYPLPATARPASPLQEWADRGQAEEVWSGCCRIAADHPGLPPTYRACAISAKLCFFPPENALTVGAPQPLGELPAAGGLEQRLDRPSGPD